MATDFQFKIVLVGDSGTGKSCFLCRWAYDSFTDKYVSTLGVDYATKILKWNNNNVNVMIWDTAGQKTFRNTTTAYYRGVQAIFIFYDITKYESFEHIEEDWLYGIKKYTTNWEDVSLVLIGNKSDLQTQREVTLEEAKNFANANKMTFFECSPKTGLNIDDVVFNTISSTFNNDNNINLHKQTKNQSWVEKQKQKLKLTKRKTQKENKKENENENDTKLNENELNTREIITIDSKKTEIFKYATKYQNINQMIYSFSSIKTKRKFSIYSFLRIGLMFLFLPLTLFIQTFCFIHSNKSKIKGSRSWVYALSPQFGVKNIKSRLFVDMLDIILRNGQDVDNLDMENALGVPEFIKQTKKELVLRCFLSCVFCVVYVFIVVIAFSPQLNKQNNLVFAEFGGPLLIYSCLTLCCSVWIGFESKLVDIPDITTISQYPLGFNYLKQREATNTTRYKIEWETEFKLINIDLFFKQININNNGSKLHILSPYQIGCILISCIYGAIPSIIKLKVSVISFLCFICNSVFVYIAIQLLFITTKESFYYLLEYMECITIILSNQRKSKHFLNESENESSKLKSNLPFLDLYNVECPTNCLSWLQLRGYLYVHIISSMINTEIWMISFAIIDIIMFGICFYLIIDHRECLFKYLFNSIEAIAFFSCLFILIIGIIYGMGVFYIGSKFNKLHLKQIKEIYAQHMLFTHSLMFNLDDDDDSQDAFALKLLLDVDLIAKYLETHDITPKVFGIRMDKVLLKSTTAFIASAIVSLTVAYFR